MCTSGLPASMARVGGTFGSDGNLYVAEAGTGGTNSTKGACVQVIAPVGT